MSTISILIFSSLFSFEISILSEADMLRGEIMESVEKNLANSNLDLSDLQITEFVESLNFDRNGEVVGGTYTSIVQSQDESLVQKVLDIAFQDFQTSFGCQLLQYPNSKLLMPINICVNSQGDFCSKLVCQQY